jgi:acetoin utilization deacetylase AcuC-like enzyme/GNAT superfamily N-acetyltransferase
MFRIRRVFDDILEIDRDEISQVQEILRRQFPLVPEKDVRQLPDVLRNPLKHRFRPILFVADDGRRTVKGFALALHSAAPNFLYLDFISAAWEATGRGVGGALYERVREEASALDASGVFFECLSDEPSVCKVPEAIAQNADRLRFYERYGAGPIIGTAYETPLKADDRCPPHLVFDGLGRETGLRLEAARKVVRAILERKYGDVCPPGYVEMVVASFRDDPVRVREPRYFQNAARPAGVGGVAEDRKIALVVAEGHEIHHVRERGYVEAPVRIRTILREIEPTGLFRRVKTRRFSEKHIREIHARDYVRYFQRVCATLGPKESVYPYVFPIRNAARPPEDLAVGAGYYGIDTFTPLSREAYEAAKGAVDCALTAGLSLLEGNRIAYALVRPPGHHAERRAFGGFCYFNSAAVAAHYLSRWGRVAVLDVDYHHANGTQDIFYRRSDVLTVSIHGHPRFAYPFFSGFEEEKGEGPGRGFNINYPLRETVEGPFFLEHVRRALTHIRWHHPAFLVVALGFDTAKGDPTGTWLLRAKDFEAAGRMIGRIRLPTLVVQEGGYNHRNLGVNARHFFSGLHGGAWEI